MITALGAVGTLAAILQTASKWISGRNMKRQSTAALWSFGFMKGRGDEPRGQMRAVLRYDDRRGPTLQLRSVAAWAPRGLRLQPIRQPFLPLAEGLGPDPAGPRLDCNKDLGGRVIGSNEVHFLVHLPKKPFWSRRNATRLQVVVECEERSADRRRVAVKVMSEEVRWLEAGG